MTSSENKVRATTAPELVLEAAGSSGTDPFTPSVAISNRPLDPAAGGLAPAGALTVRGVEGIDGTTGGLYAAGHRTVGDPWPRYAPRQVVYVTYNNEHTTIVNNTTTVVAAPNPAPTPVALTLLDLNTLQTLIRAVGGILNLEGLPPLAEPLPTPAALNTPFTTDDPEQQEANGIQADGQPAPEVERRAAAETSESSVAVAAPHSEAPGESVDPPAPAPSDPAVPVAPSASSAPAAPPAVGVPAAPATSSAAPTPTAFSGSGDIVDGQPRDMDGSSDRRHRSGEPDDRNRNDHSGGVETRPASSAPAA